MSTAAAESGVHTMGAVATRFGVHQWQVRRLYQRGLLPPAARVGAYRVVHDQDLPAVEQALKQAGYLRPEGQALLVAPQPTRGKNLGVITRVPATDVNKDAPGAESRGVQNGGLRVARHFDPQPETTLGK